MPGMLQKESPLWERGTPPPVPHLKRSSRPSSAAWMRVEHVPHVPPTSLPALFLPTRAHTAARRVSSGNLLPAAAEVVMPAVRPAAAQDA